MGNKYPGCFCCGITYDDCCFYSQRTDPDSMYVTIPALGWDLFHNPSIHFGWEYNHIAPGYMTPLFTNGLTVECVSVCRLLERLCPGGDPNKISERAYYSSVIYDENDIQTAIDIYNTTSYFFVQYGFGYIGINPTRSSFSDQGSPPISQRCYSSIGTLMYRKTIDDDSTLESEINYLNNHFWNTRRLLGCMGYGLEFLECGVFNNFSNGPTALLAEGGIPKTTSANRIIITNTMKDEIDYENSLGLPNGYLASQGAFCEEGFNVTW